MNNTANLGLAQGFMQGFDFMDRIEGRKQRRGIMMDQNLRAGESHRASMKAHERNEEEYQRQNDARLVQAMQQGIESGSIDPKIANEFGQRFDVDWTNYVNPEFGQSLQVLEGAVHGNVQMRSPEFNQAFSNVFGREIAKNTGEEIGAEGGKTWIKEKRLRGVYPGPDGKSLMVDLDVLEEGPNGQKWRGAPVTKNRSAKDDEVKAIPLEQALQKLKGHQIIYQHVQQSPELQAMIKQYGARVGAKLEDGGGKYGQPQQHPELGWVQQGPDGRMHQLKSGSTDKPMVINGQLVSSDGTVIGDYRDEQANEPVKGLSINGRLVNPYNGEVMGDYSDDAAGAAGAGGVDPHNSSVMSQIQQTTKSYFGTMNPDGSFMIPDDARESYIEALPRAQKLVQQGYPVFEAARMAALSVKKPMTEDEARQIATQEAKQQNIGWFEEDGFVDKRAKEIMQEQRLMQEQFGKAANGKGLTIDMNRPPSPAGEPRAYTGAIQRDAAKPEAQESATAFNEKQSRIIKAFMAKNPNVKSEAEAAAIIGRHPKYSHLFK